MAGRPVTFTLASGVKVTCSTDLAKKLGYIEQESEPKKAPAKKSSSK